VSNEYGRLPEPSESKIMSPVELGTKNYKAGEGQHQLISFNSENLELFIRYSDWFVRQDYRRIDVLFPVEGKGVFYHTL
jgi:hypothetical protein